MSDLGLPDGVTTCLFDLDGVLTDTASVHKTCWKRTFDEFLHAHAPEQPEFDIDADYLAHVDGKPREAGVRDFLTSRGIDLPQGERGDNPDQLTVHGLGNRKNELVHEEIRTHGVTVYEGSRRYLQAVRDAGLHAVVVSSSANAGMVLEVTGLAEYVEGRVDGVTLVEQDIKGKPAPDSFLAGAALVDATAEQAAVFEDAVSGVQAGHAGKFAIVVGIDRVGQADALYTHGADVVVTDLDQLLQEA